jgi:hypothetical protein
MFNLIRLVSSLLFRLLLLRPWCCDQCIRTTLRYVCLRLPGTNETVLAASEYGLILNRQPRASKADIRKRLS